MGHTDKYIYLLDVLQMPAWSPLKPSKTVLFYIHNKSRFSCNSQVINYIALYFNQMFY